MALAKDHQTTSCLSYVNMLEPNSSSIQFPHIISPYDHFDVYIQRQDGDGLDSPSSNKMINNQILSHSSPLSSSSSGNSSNGSFAIHHSSSYQTGNHEEVHSLMNFKTGFESLIHNNNSSGGALLSFQHELVDSQRNNNVTNNNSYNYQVWESMNQNQQHSQLFKPLKIISSSNNMRLLDQVNCLETSGDYHDSIANDQWLYAETTVIDPPQVSGSQRTCSNKRPLEEDNFQAMKKQCTSSASKKTSKLKSVSTSKDPQSLAAKNRRERISERLKILQDLVPNGSKVDLVTMLEKAIGYVKFLQLQVKVLATDEFWPAAGGKAPDISQVREAIDAILSSQRSQSTTTS